MVAGPFNSPADRAGPNGPGDVDMGGRPVLDIDMNPPGDVEGGEEDRPKLNESALLATVQSELDGALTWSGTRLNEARRDSLNKYFGNARGDERRGRSQVVTREVFESVQQVLPDLMETFTASDQVAHFVPRTEDDVDGADQATDACNWVFFQNDGFMVLHTMFQDAFIQKNGVVKVWWESDNSWEVENYEGKTIFEFFEILEDADIRVIGVSPFIDQDGERVDIELEQVLGPEGAEIDPMGVYFDVRCKRLNSAGHVTMAGIPPEEFIINRDARGIDDPTARFLAQRTPTSASALVAAGYDADLVRRIPSSSAVYTTDQDAIVRSSQDDSFPLVYSNRSDEQRTVHVAECYIRVDQDGDGISEWWKVVVAGDYGEVLLDSEQVSNHPFASVTPIPIPHRFHGQGFGDIVDDLQDVNTSLWRNYLDSLYLANDPRVIVRADGSDETAAPLCNLDQLLNSQVGGWVEEYAENAIRPFPIVNNAQAIIPAFDLHDKAVQMRTGVSADASGMNPDAISKHVYGAMVQTSASARRTALYARIFANTGVKRIFELIYQCLLQHQTAPLMLKLRGKWVPIDPTQWSRNMDCEVNVGLGHGSRFEKATHVQGMMEIQKAVAEAGLTNIVDDEKIYNSCAVFAENVGFRDVSAFFNDPKDNPPPEPEITPEQEAIQAQQEVEVMKLELDRQRLELDRYKAMSDTKKAELDHEAKIYELRLKYSNPAVPMNDPLFEAPPPPAPQPPAGVGGLAPADPLSSAGLAPSMQDVVGMEQALRARGGLQQ